MKKLISLLSIMLVCLFSASCSCDDEEASGITGECEHYWDNGKIVKEATETEQGKMSYTCILCKEEREELIAKKAHDHTYTGNWHNDRMNHWHDCDVEGCTVKGDKDNHTWDKGEILIEATQTTTGKKLFTCTICSYQKEEEYRGKATVTEAEYNYAISKEGLSNVTVRLTENGVETVMKIANGKLEVNGRVQLGGISIDVVPYGKVSYDQDTRAYVYDFDGKKGTLQFVEGRLSVTTVVLDDGSIRKMEYYDYGKTVISGD